MSQTPAAADELRAAAVGTALRYLLGCFGFAGGEVHGFEIFAVMSLLADERERAPSAPAGAGADW